jgi:hypothetical protein
MPTRTTEKQKRERGWSAEVEIRPVESAYETGSWSRVEAILTLRFSRSVGIREERGVAAAGHYLAALALDSTPPEERWAISTELITSYRDIAVAKVALELAQGSAAEMERAVTFLTGLAAIARRPRGPGLLAKATN